MFKIIYKFENLNRRVYVLIYKFKDRFKNEENYRH